MEHPAIQIEGSSPLNAAVGVSSGTDGDATSFRSLDHAPATSHGTYLVGNQERVEDLEEYQEGGYHPIHLGDLLGKDSRYYVLTKLGHGGYGTVWLCRDTQKRRYVAVKVQVAGVSSNEAVNLRLAKLDKSTPGAESLAIPSDNFTIDGPNGSHQCLVLPFLGPPASPDIWIQMEDPGPILRRMCRQTTLALNCLHQNGICHGDFRPANILIKLTNLDALSEEEILSLLGQPIKSQVMTESGQDIPRSTPRYLVAATNLKTLDRKYLTDDICVIDFGQSFLASSPPLEIGIPEGYLPPELLLRMELEDDPEPQKESENEPEELSVTGHGCDLWALGCTLFEIRQQIPLFYMMTDPGEILADIVGLLGMMPKQYWDQWHGRDQYFDARGEPMNDSLDGGDLKAALAHDLEVFLDGGVKKVLSTGEGEQQIFSDLLSRLFEYAPEKRISTAEVLRHEWFQL